MFVQQGETTGKPLEFSKILYTSHLLYEKQLTPEYRVVFLAKKQSYPELIPAYLFKILDFFKDGSSVFDLLGTYQTQYGFSFLSSSLDYLMQRGYISSGQTNKQTFTKSRGQQNLKILKIILQLDSIQSGSEASQVKQMEALYRLTDKLECALESKSFTGINLQIINPEHESLDQFSLLQKFTQKLQLFSKHYNAPLVTNLITHMDSLEDHAVEILDALKNNLTLDFFKAPHRPSEPKLKQLEKIFAKGNIFKYNGFNLTLVKPLHVDSSEEVFSFMNAILNFGIKAEVRPYVHKTNSAHQGPTGDYEQLLHKFESLFQYLLQQTPSYVPMRDFNISGLHFINPETPNSCEEFQLTMDNWGNFTLNHHFTPDTVADYAQLAPQVLKDLEPVHANPEEPIHGSCSFLPVCNRNCMATQPSKFRNNQTSEPNCKFQYHLIPKFIDFTGQISLKKLAQTNNIGISPQL